MSVKFLDLASAAVARQSDEIGDPAATRTVYAVTIALVLIGVALVVLAVWLFRATRPDPQLLAPLEQMERRGWRRLDPQDRRRALDEVRPPGAAPIAPAPRQPAVFEEFGHVRAVTGFADLAERGDRSVTDGRTGRTDQADQADQADGADHVDGAALPRPHDPLVIDTVLADPALLADPEPLAPPTPGQEPDQQEPVPSLPAAHVDRAPAGDAAAEHPVHRVRPEGIEHAEAVESDPTPPGHDDEWAPFDPPTSGLAADDHRRDDVGVQEDVAADVVLRGVAGVDPGVDVGDDGEVADGATVDADAGDVALDDDAGEPLMPGEGLLRRRRDAR